MDYIHNTPHIFNYKNRFLRPYAEGVNNIAVAINPECALRQKISGTLAGRIHHLAVGLLLLVPIINTIAMKILLKRANQSTERLFEIKSAELEEEYHRIDYEIDELDRVLAGLKERQNEYDRIRFSIEDFAYRLKQTDHGMEVEKEIRINQKKVNSLEEFAAENKEIKNELSVRFEEWLSKLENYHVKNRKLEELCHKYIEKRIFQRALISH